MTVEVQFFSRLRDLAGGQHHAVELADGATVGDLLSRLYARHSALGAWDPHILVAVDLEYAGRDHVLRDGDSVSIMPPVQGG